MKKSIQMREASLSLSDRPRSQGSSFKYLSFFRILLVFLFTSITSGYGQAALYQFSSSLGTYTPLVSPTLLTGSDLKDSWASPVTNIGFNFVLNGVTYTQFSATSNGWIRLGATAASAYTATPISTSNSGPAIAFFARDGKTSASGITYQLSGTAPNQVLTVEYNDYWVYYGGSSNLLSAQIKLYEGTNKIEIVYGPSTRASTYTAQVGLVGTATSDYNNRTSSTDWSAPSAGTSNTSSMTLNTTVAPVSGRTYTWALPTCFQPTAVNATNITATSADITWTDNNATSPADGWIIEYGPAGFAHGSGTLVSVPAGTASSSISSLASSTSYDVYVRSVCAAGSDSSSWSQVKNFLTPCQPVSIYPYTEGFNSTSLPVCYTATEGSSGASQHWQPVTADASNGAGAPLEGSHFLRMNYYSASASYNPYYLNTPSFVLDATAKEATFDLFLGSASGTNHLKFEVSTDGGASWTILQTYTSNPATTSATSAWDHKIVDLSAYANQTIMLRLAATSNYGSGRCNIGFDNFIIHDIPQCQVPTSLSASALTDVSATLNWAASSTTTATDYNWIVVAAGAGSTGTPVASGSTTGSVLTASATGLTGNTAYEFYVQTNCGSGALSSWAGPGTFTTLCSPVMDFTQDFEGTTGSIFPTCWTKVGTGGTAYPQSNTGISGAKNLYLYSGSTSSLGVVSMPPVSTGSLGTYRLVFKARGSSSTGGVIEVGYLTDPADPATFTSLSSYTTTSTTVPDEFALNGITLPAGVTTLAFRHTGSPTNSVLIDDVVYELMPTCLNPTALSSTASLNSATVTWTDNNTNSPAGGWIIEYGAPGFTLGTGTTLAVPAGTASAMISGLTAETNYVWYVRAVCTPSSDTSAWSSSGTFYTGYCNPAPSSVDGSGITNVTFGNAPNVVNNTTGSETGNYGNYSSQIGDLQAGALSTISVQYSTGYTYGTKIWIDLNDNLDFEASELLYTGLSTSSNPTILSCNLTIPAGATPGNHRMRIGGTDNNAGPSTPCYTGSYGSFEDYTVNVLAPPSCLAPTNPLATNVTSNSADLGWTDANTPAPSLGWEIEYGPAGFTPGTGTLVSASANPHSLTSLSSSTIYGFYVRSICAIGDTSAWSAAGSFTTTCAPVTTFPYSEGFNATSLPLCYTASATGSATYNWEPVTSDLSHGASAPSEGTGFLRMNYFNASTSYNPYYLKTPEFVLDATPKETHFDLWMGANSGTNNLDIEITTDGGTTWTVLNTYTANAANSTNTAPWQSEIINLSAYANQTVQFRLKANSNYGSSICNIGFDNFLIQDIPPCQQATNLTATNITSSGADINWAASGSPTATNYNWVVVAAGAAPTATAVASGTVASTVLTAAATGLSGLTTYDAYVQTDCGSGGTSAWSGPVQFTTLCANVSQYPHVETFSTFTPTCWTQGDGGATATGPATTGSSDWTSDGFVNNGTTGAARINIFSSTDMDWLISPSFDIPASPPYSLVYDAGATQYGSTNPPTYPWEPDDSVLVMVSMNNGASWTSIYSYNDQNTPSNIGQNERLDLSAYAGQTIKIAFVSIEGSANGSADIDFSIDNFTIEQTPTCFPVANIAVSNTGSISTDISWSAPTAGTLPAGYGYIVVPAGSGSAAVPVAQGSVSGTSATATPLSPNTSYDVYVQTDCGGGDISSWSGPVNFTTLCAAAVAPYAYSVETAAPTTNSSIADCWMSSPSGTSSSFRWDVDGSGSTPSSSTGPNAANGGVNYFYTEASSGVINDTAFLLSPMIDVSTLTIPYLQYSYFMYGSTMGNLYTQIWDGTAFVTVDSLIGQQQISATLPWQTAGIDVSAIAASTTQIRFVGTRGSSYEGDIAIDDIALIEAPACINPSALTATFNPTTGNTDVSWTAPQGTAPTQYNYVVVKADSGYASSNIVASGTSTSSPAAVAGLMSNVSYDIYVQSDCGSGSTSLWTGPLTYSPPCTETLPYTQDFEGTGCLPTCWSKENLNGDIYSFCMAGQVPCAGAKSMRLDPNTSSTAPANNDWVYSPLFNLTAGTSYRIKFTYKNDDPAKRQKLAMYVGGTQLNASQTTPLFLDDSISSGMCQNVVIDYTPTASGLASFGFHAYADAGQGFIGIDDFSVDVTPAMTTWSIADNNNDDACADSSLYGLAGNAWHELYDASGNIVVSINPNGNNLGKVDIQYVDRSVPDEWGASNSPSGQLYKAVPRRFAITPQYQPTTPVDVRFYFLGQELDDFNASSLGTGVTSYGIPALLFTKHEVDTPDCTLQNNVGTASLISFIDGLVGTAPTTGSQDFYVQATVTDFSEFTLHEPTISIGPLNISFENFRGQIVNGHVDLAWNLRDAILGNQVEIEKLHSGIWRSIGKLEVNSSESYTFTDPELAAVNTYRLSYLGKKSEVLSLKDQSGTIITIYPNPADDYIKIEAENAASDILNVNIYDVVGRTMITQSIPTSRNSAEAEIQIGNLPAGSYLIKVDDSNTVLYNRALIVK